MILSVIVVLSCSSFGFTKPVFLDRLVLRNQAFRHPPRDQENQPQSDTIHPEESISQESDDTSGVEAFLDSPAAHNRTARDADHPCYSKIVSVLDPCRNDYVNHVVCLNKHVKCFQAIYNHHYPKCKTVYGYHKAKFISKCAMVPIGCQCASWNYSF